MKQGGRAGHRQGTRVSVLRNATRRNQKTRKEDVLRKAPRHAGRSGGGGLGVSGRLAAVDGLRHASPTDAVDWEDLGFSCEHVAKTQMFVATATLSQDGSGQWEWAEEGIGPYRCLELDPSAQVLNYGQSIFEGMKAQRTTDGNLVLFRPEENASRMRDGAARMSMAPPPKDLFLRAVKATVAANAEFVPPNGKGSLYLRPILLGTGAILGLGPAPSYTFLVYCSPVGAYFKGGQLTPIRLKVEEEEHRAAPGGTGNTKCAGNYSPVLNVQLQAKAQGFNDVLYLDAVENKYVEEVSSCNIFAVFGNKIVTPSLGTILPGVTRRSIIDLARSKGFEVEEAPLSIEEVLKADEVFTTGTAVVLSPVGYIEHGAEKREYGGYDVALALYDSLTGIQQQTLEDPFDWVVQV
ncbi:branched-chain amino acid aminotransferase [Chloropicon primus]|uniref:Branched-chain-amino-acid aminotransferase n=1 Tax=Chloropicon primus TaxID=1764295 RepID=A0A7S2X1W7_9CHLO|nr:branched-chain amino acid aminotransferase [Chloropicon primus]|mmetsp:Transcript_6678/g.19566  ORF Transcript_6678/g.19566 Transcript_6678/m.19566 type:complete len:408 (+) Transcript_6678:2-1225(+)